MKAISRLLLAALLVGPPLVARADPILLSLTPVSQIVPIGTAVRLDLGISGLGDGAAPSLGAFDILVGFDPSLMTLSDVAFDTGLGDPNAAPPEAYTSLDDSVFGLVQLIDTSVLEANDGSCVFCTGPYLDFLQSGAFRLAALTFLTIGTGTSSLTLSINSLADADALDLIADVAGAQLTVVPASGTPVPGSLALLALGLVVLVLRRASA